MKSGKRPNKRVKRLRLGKRDRALLAHIASFRMTWFEVVHAVAFSGLKPNAVKSTLRRLRNPDRPLIRAHPLYGKRVYYQLTYGGTRTIGVSHRAAESLGRTTIVRQFALQSFLYLGEREQRRLLSKAQIATVFDAAGRRLPRAHFYLASTGKDDKRFGFVIVDYGNDPRRCANRVVERVLQLVAAPRVCTMAESGMFEISVLTVTASKRRSLYERLKVSKKTGGMMQLTTANSKRVKVRLLIHVIPGLFELVPDNRE